MADALDILRKDAFDSRVKGMAGGHRIRWSPKHEAQIRQHIAGLSEKVLLAAAEVKLLDSQGPVGPMGAMVLRAMDSTALSWTFQITNEEPDLCLDVIKRAGWNFKNF